MKHKTKRRLLLAATVGLLAGVVAVADINWTATARELATADPRLVLAALVVSLVAQFAWGTTHAGLLATIDPAVNRNRVRLGYLTATFVKQILPFGHIGGPAVMAYVLSEDLDIEYRRTFASVTAGELLVFIGSLLALGIGVGSIAATVVSAPRITAVAIGVGIAVVIPASIAITSIVIDERRVVTRLVVFVAAVSRWSFGRIIPALHRRLSIETVTRELGAFFDTYELATGDRSTVLTAVGIALGGWVLFCLPLYFGFLAVGDPVSIGIVLFLVPASGVAVLLPTPGGLGGVEVGLAAGVIALSGVTVESAAAAVLIHRVCTYWFVVCVGAVSSLAVSVNLTTVTRPAEADMVPADGEQ